MSHVERICYFMSCEQFHIASVKLCSSEDLPHFQSHWIHLISFSPQM